MRRVIVRVYGMLFLFIGLDTVTIAQEEWVYSVRVERDGKRFVLSGFREKGRTGIITALHGVVGANNISAKNKNGETYPDLQIIEVDIKNDLVLLSSPKLEKTDDVGFTPSLEIPLSGTKVEVLGHPFGANGVRRTRENYMGYPVLETLGEFLNDNVSNIFRDRGSPDPDADVFFIEGSFVPGHSGAPLVVNDHFVIGVVNGGLGGGRASISWAIPLSSIEWRSYGAVRSQVQRLVNRNLLELYSYEVIRDESVSSLSYVLPGYHQLKYRKKDKVTTAVLVMDGLALGLGVTGLILNDQSKNTFKQAQGINLGQANQLDFDRFNDLVEKQKRQILLRDISYITAGTLMLINWVFVNKPYLNKIKRRNVRTDQLSASRKWNLEPFSTSQQVGLSLTYSIRP